MGEEVEFDSLVKGLLEGAKGNYEKDFGPGRRGKPVDKVGIA